MWTIDLKQPQPAYRKRKGTPLRISNCDESTYLSVKITSKRIDLIVLARQKDSSNFFVRECTWRHWTMLTLISVILIVLILSTQKLVWYSLVGLQNIMRKIFIYCGIIIPCLLNIKKWIHVYIVICCYHSFKMTKGW